MRENLYCFIGANEMRVLIIYAHPNPNSFNHAILENICFGLQEAGHEVRVKDLYGEKFNPVLGAKELAVLQTGKIPEKIKKEQETLFWAEGLIFIYPLWWFSAPAILKGWFDHALTNGKAFEYTADGGVHGLLKHQRALVLITAGATEKELSRKDAQDIAYPVTTGTLGFCGIQDVFYRIFYRIPTLSHQERVKILNEVSKMGKQFSESIF